MMPTRVDGVRSVHTSERHLSAENVSGNCGTRSDGVPFPVTVDGCCKLSDYAVSPYLDKLNESFNPLQTPVFAVAPLDRAQTGRQIGR